MQVPVNSQRGRTSINLVSHRLNDPSLDILKSDRDLRKAVTEEGWVKKSKCLQFSQPCSLHAHSQGCTEAWYFQVCDASPLLWKLQRCYGRTRGFPLYGGCGVSNSRGGYDMSWTIEGAQHCARLTVHIFEAPLCSPLLPFSINETQENKQQPQPPLSCINRSNMHALWCNGCWALLLSF